VDAACRRVKVKNPAYLAIAYSINAGGICSDRHFARLAIQGDAAEVKGEFPELAADIERFERVLDDAKREAARLWEAHRSAPTRKNFALSVRHARLAPWLFQAYGGEPAPIDEWVRENLHEDRLLAWAAASSGA